MPDTVFDARGLHLPPFDEGFKVGRGSLMPLVYQTVSANLPIGQSVKVYGQVPEDEVWRVVKLNVNDSGSSIIPQWQELAIALKLGAYTSELPPGEKNAGAFRADDDAWLGIWQKFGKVTGGGNAWWRTIAGWSFGPDPRWILPKHTFETWIDEDGQAKNTYQPAQNLTISLWPAGCEFRVSSNVQKTGAILVGYAQRLTVVVLRQYQYLGGR